MSSDLATQPKQKSLRDLLEAPNVRAGISAALGGFMDEGNFLAQMLIAFQSPGTGDRPGVIDCTLDSKFKAAHLCATLGLLPTLGQVALIPRDIKNQGLCCTVMPQWQGFQALMLRHPDVKTVKATLVHSSDSYGFDPETESIVNHTYDPFDPKRTFHTFEDLRGGYLAVTFKDGRPKQYHCVKLDVFQKARKCAQADNIWTKYFEEQCLKTVYRNAYARRVIPIDPFAAQRLQGIVEAEDDALENDPNRIVVAPSSAITYQPVDQPAQSRTEKAAAKMKKPVETKPAEDESKAPETESVATTTTPEPARDESKAAVNESAKPKSKSADPFDVQIAKAVKVQELDAIANAISEAVSDGRLNGDEAGMYRAALMKKRKRFEGD